MRVRGPILLNFRGVVVVIAWCAGRWLCWSSTLYSRVRGGRRRSKPSGHLTLKDSAVLFEEKEQGHLQNGASRSRKWVAGAFPAGNQG